VRFARLLVRCGVAFLLVTGAAGLLLRNVYCEPYQYTRDPKRGRVPRPGSAHFQAAEGHAVAHYNRLSLHDRELEPKAVGERRLLVLGDSLAEAVEVADDENFSRKLEPLLQQPDHLVRVVNAGRMANLSGELIHNAETLQPEVQADAALVVVQPASFGTDGDAKLLAPGYWSAKYVEAPDGSAELVTLDGASFALKKFTALLWLKEHSAVLDTGFSQFIARGTKPGGAAPPPDLAVVQKRVAFAIGRLEAIYGPRLVIALMPRRPLIDDPEAALEDPRERAIREAAERAQVRFWSARETFVDTLRRTHRLPVGFANASPPDVGHLNVLGHQLVAEKLAPLLHEVLR
jgi:lysophospholipase L1-like esterase